VFSNQGQYDKALNWYQWALDGNEKTLGQDHPGTLTPSTASVFSSQGEYDRALKWYQRALDGCKKTLGMDHPFTLTTVQNMASVVNGQSRPAGFWGRRVLAALLRDPVRLGGLSGRSALTQPGRRAPWGQR